MYLWSKNRVCTAYDESRRAWGISGFNGRRFLKG